MGGTGSVVSGVFLSGGTGCHSCGAARRAKRSAQRLIDKLQAEVAVLRSLVGDADGKKHSPDMNNDVTLHVFEGAIHAAARLVKSEIGFATDQYYPHLSSAKANSKSRWLLAEFDSFMQFPDDDSFGKDVAHLGSCSDGLRRLDDYKLSRAQARARLRRLWVKERTAKSDEGAGGPQAAAVAATAACARAWGVERRGRYWCSPSPGHAWPRFQRCERRPSGGHEGRGAAAVARQFRRPRFRLRDEPTLARSALGAVAATGGGARRS